MTDTDRCQWIARVDEALNSIRPHLQVDGGNVEVVDIADDMVVSVRWLGTCQTCSMSKMTMRAGIEETLRKEIPEIAGVRAVNGVNTSPHSN